MSQAGSMAMEHARVLAESLRKGRQGGGGFRVPCR